MLMRKQQLTSGLLHVRFECTTQLLDFRFTFQHESTKRRDTYVSTESRSYVSNQFSGVIARLDQLGAYVINVDAKPRGSRLDFRRVASVLHENVDVCAEDSLLNVNPNTKLGELTSDERLLPESHPTPYIEADLENDEDCVTIEMTSRQMVDVRVKALFHSAVSPNIVYMTSYTWVSATHAHNVSQFFIDVRLPKAGVYDVTLSCETKPGSKTYVDAYRYAIVIERASRCLPFPTRLQSWMTSFGDVTPADGFLCENEAVEFRVQLPQCRAVAALVGDDKEEPLHEDGLAGFRKVLDLPSGSCELVVAARFNNIARYSKLLLYKARAASVSPHCVHSAASFRSFVSGVFVERLARHPAAANAKRARRRRASLALPTEANRDA